MARRTVLTGARAVLLPLLLLASPAGAAETLNGVALAIGQSDYKTLSDLDNTGRDAEAVEKLLDRLGFDTSGQTDRSARQLSRDLEGFLDDAEDADVAVLYYAGHAVEIGGENYLLPTDVDASSPEALAEKLVPLSATVNALQKKVPVTIVLLDACRDNPLPPGTTVRLTADGEPMAVSTVGTGTRGVTVLSRQSDAPADNLGIVVAFATEPGKVALDGDPGGNSPYAAALVRHLSAMTGAEFGTVMRMVAEEVYLKTAGRQRPWVNESLRRLLYFGRPAPEQNGPEGSILKERRQLLLTIAGLPDTERSSIESVARQGGVPLDAVYGMLKALGAEAPSDPARLEALLREQTEQIRKMQADRAAIQSTDPEIRRLADLAEQAIAEGALDTAGELNREAKERVAEIETTVSEAEADIKARRLEFAQVYARSGKTAYMRFDYEQSAADYAQAFLQVERWDDWSAWSYRGNQAVALQAMGWRGGQTPRLYEALDLAREIVRLAERLPGREEWVLSQVFLGNTLTTLGQRQNDVALLREATVAYRAALDALKETGQAFDIDVPEVGYNLAGVEQQIAYREKDEAALERAAAAFASLAEAAGRETDPLRWARATSSQASALVDLSRFREDRAGMRRAVTLLEQAMQAGRDVAEQEDLNDYLRLLAVAQSEVGIMEDSLEQLLVAQASFDRSIPEIDRSKAPVVWATALHNRAINEHNLYLTDNDPAWLERAIADYTAAAGARDRTVMPRDWSDAMAGIAGTTVDLGRHRKDVAMVRDGAQKFRDARAALDPTKDRDEWLRLGWLATDALRGEAEITAEAATLQSALDEFAALVAEAKRSGTVNERLYSRLASTAHSYATIAGQIGYETALAGIDRAASILGDASPGAAAGTQSARGRALYGRAVAEKDAAIMRRSIEAYRASLVPEAKVEPHDGFANAQGNLAIALKELGRMEKSAAYLSEAIAVWREAQGAEKDETSWRNNQRGLAGALEEVGTAGAFAESAVAWDTLLQRIGENAPAAERADLLEKKGLSLHNQSALETDAKAIGAARRAAITAYRAASALLGTEAIDARVRLGENLGDLVKAEGDLAGDQAQVREAASLYAVILEPAAASVDPAIARRMRLKHANALLSAAYATGDGTALPAVVDRFAEIYGEKPGASEIGDGWSDAAAYGNALRMLGQSRADAALLARSSAVLAAATEAAGASLDPDSTAWLDASRAETLTSLATIGRDAVAAREAVAFSRRAAAHYTEQSYPAGWRGPHGGLASALLVLGDLVGDAAAFEEAAAVYRRLIDATPRPQEDLAWADYANGRAYALANAARLGKGDIAALEGAVSLAREARAVFAAQAPASVPHVDDTLCSAMIEAGRLSAARSTVEQALRTCDASLSAFKAAAAPNAAEVERTIARGKAVLAAMR